jgi:hypothetical protein
MNIVLWALVAIAAVAVGKQAGKLLFTGKKNLTGMRKAAQDLAIALRKAGLEIIPVHLEAFAVGDVDDLLEGVKELSIMLKSGNGVILTELDSTFERVLGVKLSSPEGRALIAAKLAEASVVAVNVAKVVAVAAVL